MTGPIVISITAAQLNIRFNSEGASQVKNDLDGVGQGVARTATGFDKMKGAALGMGTALIMPMGIGLKAAVALEQSLANVNASLGGLDSGTLDKLSASFQQIGADSMFSATEVATMADELAKAGFGAEELLGGMTQAVVDLSQATGDGLGPALDGVVQAMSTWKPGIVDATIAMTDASRVADILTVAANSSKAGIGDINAGMRSLGPVAAMLGIPFEDAAAGIALFTNNGLRGADAGVSLARGLQNLAAPSASVESGLSDLGLSMEGLGIAAFDASGEFVGMPTLFRQLQDGLGGLDKQTQLAALSTIFGAEAIDVMGLAIMQGAEPLEAIIALMGESGTAAEQSALRMDTLGAQFDTLKEGVTTFLGSLVQGLIPGMRMVVDGANVLVDVLMKIPGPIKTIIGAVAGVLAAFAAVNIAMTTSAALSGLLGISFAGVGAAMGAILPIVLAVAAVAGVLYLAWKTNFLGIRDLVDGVLKKVKGFAKGFKRAIDAFQDVWDAADDVTIMFGDFALVIDGVGDSINVVSRFLYSLSAAFSAIGLDRVAEGLQFAASFLDDLITGFRELQGTMNPLLAVINAFQYAMAMNGIYNAPGWLLAIENAAIALTGAIDELVQRFQGLRALGLNPVSAALIAIGTTFESLAPLMNDLAGIVSNVTDAFGAFVAGDYAAGFDALGEAARSAWDAIREGGALLSGVVVRIGSWVFEQAVDLGSAFASWITDTAIPAIDRTARSLGTMAVSIADWAVDALVDLGSKVSSWITDTALPAVDKAARSLGTFMVEIAGWLVTASIDLGTKVGSWIRDTALPGVDKAARDLGTFLVNIAGWLVTTSIDLGTKVGAWIRDTALPAVDKTARDLGTFIVNIAGWLVTTTIDLATKVSDWIVNTALPAVDKTARDLGTFIANVGGWLVTQTTDLASAITAKITEWLNAFSITSTDVITVATKLGAALNDAIALGITITQDLATKLYDWLTEQINSVDWNSVGSSFGTLFVAGVKATAMLIGFAGYLLGQILLALVELDWGSVASSFGTLFMASIEAIGNFLVGFGTAVYDEIVAELGNVDWAAVGGVINEGLLGIGELINTGVKALFDVAMDGITAYLGEKLNPLIEDVNELIEAMNKLPGVDIPEIAFFGQLAEDANAAKMSVDELAASLTSIFAQAGGGVGGIVAGALGPAPIGPPMPEGGSSRGFESAGPGGGGRGSGAGRGAKGESFGGGSGMMSGMLTEIQNVTTALTNLGTSFTTAQTNVTTFVATTIGVMGGWAIGLGVMFTTLGLAFTTLGTNILTLQTAIITFVATTIGVLGGWIIGLGVMFLTFGTTLTTASLALTTFQTGIVTFVATTIGVMGGWITGLGVMFTTYGTALTTAGTNTVTFQTTIVNFVATTIGVMGGWIGGISTMMATFGAEMAGGESDVRSFASEVSTQMGAIRRSVESGMGDATRAVRSEAGKWAGIIDGISGAMRRAGENAGVAGGQGVAAGIRSQQGAVRNEAAALADIAAGAFQSALNARSPSRVFMKIAETIGQGVVLGIDHLIPTVISKAQQMVEMLKDVLSQTLAGPSIDLNGKNPLNEYLQHIAADGDWLNDALMSIPNGKKFRDAFREVAGNSSQREALRRYMGSNDPRDKQYGGVLRDGDYGNDMLVELPRHLRDTFMQWGKYIAGSFEETATGLMDYKRPTQAPQQRQVAYAQPVQQVHNHYVTNYNRPPSKDTYLVISRELLEDVQDSVTGFKVLTSPAEVAAAQGII